MGIELLQYEIDVKPGESVPLERPRAGQVDRAVLHIENDTGQEKAYSVSLRCTAPGWISLRE